MLELVIFAIWYKFQVDTASAAGTGIVVDMYNRPHVFYYSNNFLIHAFWNGNTWQKEIVDSAATYHNGGPAVIIDHQNCIHVAYFHRSERLYYAFYDGNWHKEKVDTAYRTGDYCDIALGPNNLPRIAYHRSIGWFSGYLRYAVKGVSGWQIYEHSGEYGGYHASIELDNNGNPHISDCTSWSNGSLRYIYHDGQAWHYEKPTGTTQYTSGYNSLALNFQGLPQISYYWANGTHFDLRFVEKNTGSWVIHIVDPGTQLDKRGWDNKIAIDSSGILHIVYHCHNTGLLKYARGWGSNWVRETVDTIGGYTASTSITLKGNDVFLSYYDETTTDVWVASTKNFVEIEEKDKYTSNCFFILNGVKFNNSLKLYDLTGSLYSQSNLKLQKILNLKKSGIYFFKTTHSVYKLLIIR